MPKSPSQVSRRVFITGAASVGAVAIGALAVPAVREAEPAAKSKPMPARGGGYTESEHVKRYYQTTRI